jgi:hypothetical protein
VLTVQRVWDLTMAIVANRASLFRRPAWRAVALGAAVAVLGCQQPRSDWNKVFQRSQGWLYADGGSSAELSGGRRVWFFGDSMIRHENGLVYNTVAVSDADPGRAPAAGELRFFARAEGGDLLDVSQEGSDRMHPWLEPTAGGAGAPKTWLWPTDVVETGGTLAAFYSEVGCVRGELPGCRSFLGNMGFLGHHVLSIDNPSDAPQKWKTRTMSLLDRRGKPPSDNRLHWGSAVIQDGGWLYVFGTSLNDHDGPEDVKLARVVPEELGRYDLWQFLGREGFRMFPTGATPDDLVTLARGGATEFSVDRVVRGGASWFVMLQVAPFSQEIIVRSAAAADLPSARWDGPDEGPGVRHLSLARLDPASEKGMTWSGRAVRRRQETGDSLLVSYFSSQAASLRFIDLPLSEVRQGW